MKVSLSAGLSLLGLLIASAGLGADVTIEDRIGNLFSLVGDRSMSSDISHRPIGTNYAATVSKVFNAHDVFLKRIQGVGIPYNVDGPTSPDDYTWKMAIHSQASSAITNTLNGDVVDLVVLPTPARGVVEVDSLGRTSYLFTFHLQNAEFPPIALMENRHYWITILGESNHLFDWAESEQPGESDLFVFDDSLVLDWVDVPGFTTGRAALRFIGELRGPPGDFDGNGEVDAFDYFNWRDNFGGAASGFGGADGNGDGTINASDFVIWRDRLGATSETTATTAVPEPNVIALFLLWPLLVRFLPTQHAPHHTPNHHLRTVPRILA